MTCVTFCLLGIAGTVVAILLASFSHVDTPDTPKCSPPYVAQHVRELPRALDDRVYGQPVAKSVILAAITGHVDDNNPKKALVLSLHGPVGVGKSYVAGIVAEHLYRDGVKSPFVHKLVGSKDFAHQDEVRKYKRDLQKWVEQGVRTCERSLFIIEEVHEVPPGVLDALKPYLDYDAILGGVDYTKAIFIFASNIGDVEVNQYAHNHWLRGGTRQTIKHKEMNQFLSQVVFNKEGGLKKCGLINRKMISALVAFLPLERQHVKLCAKDELRRRGYDGLTDEMVERVADDATYQEHFSVNGCKGVEDAVNRELFQRGES